MSAVNLHVSGVGEASPHASAASSASRTISERRFPVRAASWSSLALSPWGSRTVTDGERTPGELSGRLNEFVGPMYDHPSSPHLVTIGVGSQVATT